MTETTRLSIQDITVAGGRPVSAGRVTVLADSMKAIGLRTPITVKPSIRIVSGRPSGGYEVVTGRHRLGAARKLGWTEIDVVVMDGSAEDAELWEIDENFARAELSDAERADHHARREKILIAKGLVRGGTGRAKNSEDSSELKSYADHTAPSLGVTDRTVRQDLRRGKNIDPTVLADVTNTELDSGVVLDELARTPKDDQRAKLLEIQQRRSTVRLAPDPLNDPEAHEKQLSGLMAAWNRAAAPVRQEFMLRIDAPVFDQTRVGAA